MTLFWGSSYGFPKPLPTGRFKRYIRRNEYEASHFYSAYPQATTTMVNAALTLDPMLLPFSPSWCSSRRTLERPTIMGAGVAGTFDPSGAVLHHV
ncbi:MAG TPA: hypothetical protein VGV57_13940 [Thermoleophilaceae bacterium]|nr:hypothetical protein [Thermoleophilaceae bacterium]